MKALFDTNVVLDVLLDRRPFSVPAAHLLGKVERGELEGLIGATTVTTVHYLVNKAAGREAAKRAIQNLLSLLEVAPVDRQVLDLAAMSTFDDFEDAVLHEAGRLAGAEIVLTRDPDGFLPGVLPVVSPQELWATLETAQLGGGDG